MMLVDLKDFCFLLLKESCHWVCLIRIMVVSDVIVLIPLFQSPNHIWLHVMRAFDYRVVQLSSLFNQFLIISSDQDNRIWIQVFLELRSILISLLFILFGFLSFTLSLRFLWFLWGPEENSFSLLIGFRESIKYKASVLAIVLIESFSNKVA